MNFLVQSSTTRLSTTRLPKTRFRVRVAACLMALPLIALPAGYGQSGYGQAGNGQVDSGGTQSSEIKRYSVRGSVVNSVTGGPIARALVNLGARGDVMTMTDSNGSFVFEGVAEGQARLTAERPGFFPSDERGRLLSIAADVDSLVIALAPQAVITGRIISIQNVPIEDLPVRLYRRTYVNGRMKWQMASLVSSDDDGQFRVPGLTAGSYCLSAGPEHRRLWAPGARPRGYPQVFYPNAADFSSASVITIGAGQQVEADLSVTAEPLFEISGQVVGVPPGKNAIVQLANSAGESMQVQQMHPERQDFKAYVTAGRYVLKAFAAHEGESLQGAVPLTVAGDTAGIQVPVGLQTSIAVNVRTESGGGNSGREPPASVMLLAAANGLNTQLWAQPIASRQGGLAIQGAEPGTYSVEIWAHGKYVVSATSGTADLLRDDLVVSADGRAEPIEIVLGSDGGEVSGNVQLAGHAGTATVLLVPEHGAAGQVKSTSVQGAGEFQFEQVRPGDYLLLALEHGDELEYQNPDVLGSYLSSATRISVASKQQVTASLELVSSGK